MKDPVTVAVCGLSFGPPIRTRSITVTARSAARHRAGGGYAINLGGDYSSLEVEGDANISVYQAIVHDEETGKREKSRAQRHFCNVCGSALWIWDPRWPELVHPYASAIDSELPVPPERTHLMVDSKAPWVELREGPNDKVFVRYPDESIASWHKRLGLEDPDR